MIDGLTQIAALTQFCILEDRSSNRIVRNRIVPRAFYPQEIICSVILLQAFVSKSMHTYNKYLCRFYSFFIFSYFNIK